MKPDCEATVLSACPFCSVPGEIWHFYDDRWIAGCQNENCHIMPRTTGVHRGDAIKNWEKRVQSDLGVNSGIQTRTTQYRATDGRERAVLLLEDYEWMLWQISQVDACRKILGYDEGDLLDNVTRYHAYATQEIELLRAGGERVAAYARKLQELLPQETVMKLGPEAMACGFNMPGSPELDPASGSAIAHQNRRRVWEELEAIKMWTARLEAELQKEPDGVIPYLHLKSISDSVTDLLYAAGQVNALRLAGGKKSPNTELKHSNNP